MLGGPNVGLYLAVTGATSAPVIPSGGIDRWASTNEPLSCLHTHSPDR